MVYAKQCWIRLMLFGEQNGIFSAVTPLIWDPFQFNSVQLFFIYPRYIHECNKWTLKNAPALITTDTEYQSLFTARITFDIRQPSENIQKARLRTCYAAGCGVSGEWARVCVWWHSAVRPGPRHRLDWPPQTCADRLDGIISSLTQSPEPRLS